MALAEKRTIEDFKKTKFDSWKKQICDAAGFEINIQVEWDSLAQEGYAHVLQEGFEKVYFMPIVEALKQVCRDDLGKQVVKSHLQEIMICNKTSSHNPENSVSLDSRRLKIDLEPATNIDEQRERTERIVRLLENAN